MTTCYNNTSQLETTKTTFAQKNAGALESEKLIQWITASKYNTNLYKCTHKGIWGNLDIDFVDHPELAKLEAVPEFMLPNLLKVEVKTDYNATSQNVVAEIISNENINSLGWSLTTAADIIAWHYPRQNKIHLLHGQAFVRYVKENYHKYIRPKRKLQTDIKDNMGRVIGSYTTHIRLIPKADLIKHGILYATMDNNGDNVISHDGKRYINQVH